MTEQQQKKKKKKKKCRKCFKDWGEKYVNDLLKCTKTSYVLDPEITSLSQYCI